MKLKITLCVLAFILALRLVTYFYNQEPLSESQVFSESVLLLSQPQREASTQKFTISSMKGYRIYVTAQLLPEYVYGDRLKIQGNIKISQHGSYYLNFPKIEEVQGQNSRLLAMVGILRQKIVKIFEANLSQKDSSLMLGIVFGIKRPFPSDFNEALKNTGLMHVIAASGMNVTIVGGFIASTFMIFLRRQLAMFLSIAGIAFYALLAGLEPSIVRAAIMGGAVCPTVKLTL